MKAAKTKKGGGRLLSAAALAAFLAGLWPATPAASGAFQVNPVNITLPADRQATSLTIKNSDTKPVAVRVVTYSWTQENGRDIYSETRDVIVSPPIFTIQPGGTQLVRIGLRSRSAKAYRVIFEEIVRQQPSSSQIQVALRLNLPLYLPPPGGGKADVRWKAWRDGAGDLFIEADNRGSAHAQVLEIAASDRAGGQTILSKQMGVILPASARRWKIGNRPDFGVGASMTLQIRSPTGDMQAAILVEQR